MSPPGIEEGLALPEPVRALAERLGCGSTTGAKSAHVSQVGRMRSNADAKWMSFRAEQTIGLDACSFSWVARTGPFGSVRIVDALDRGTGHLQVTALGLLPLMRSPASPELDRGELMRYLAEIVWAPEAILRNRSLYWQVLDNRNLSVSVGQPDRRATVKFKLDEQGRIADVTAADRPMISRSGVRFLPWFGHVADYRHHNGYWLPFRAEAGWEIDGERIILWEGSITDWRPVPKS
ncbi:MAG: DUF6544 family protein [Pseudomonadota bacterium]|jgi:hypothetical protein